MLIKNTLQELLLIRAIATKVLTVLWATSLFILTKVSPSFYKTGSLSFESLKPSLMCQLGPRAYQKPPFS